MPGDRVPWDPSICFWILQESWKQNFCTEKVLSVFLRLTEISWQKTHTFVLHVGLDKEPKFEDLWTTVWRIHCHRKLRLKLGIQTVLFLRWSNRSSCWCCISPVNRSEASIAIVFSGSMTACLCLFAILSKSLLICPQLTAAFFTACPVIDLLSIRCQQKTAARSDWYVGFETKLDENGNITITIAESVSVCTLWWLVSMLHGILCTRLETLVSINDRSAQSPTWVRCISVLKKLLFFSG